MRRISFAVVGALACVVAGCGSDSDPAGTGEDPLARLPYAREVVSFSPGEGAGFGEDKLPDVVLGPPHGKGLAGGSLDVLSLGTGGEIVLGFGDRAIVDGPGPDFVVFENAFYAGGDPTAVFAEPGEVSVSADGLDFVSFDCEAAGDAIGGYEGCAGVTPTLAFDPEQLVPLDPTESGGDAFDLEGLGLSEVRYVRIRDVSGESAGPNAGFDLDAVGIVNASE
jgi:hypothetical protein